MLLFHRAVLARGLGYTTANFTALISPILMYTLTHSLVLAGLGLIMELIPKILVYLYGSAWIYRYSAHKIHPALEATRWICLCLLLAVAFRLCDWWMIPLAGGLMQISNAFSNLLFEQYASSWNKISTQHTYTAFVQADLFGGLLATGITMLIGVPTSVLGISLCVQGCLFFFIYANKDILYPAKQSDNTTLKEWCHTEWKRPWKTFRQMDRTLWTYVLFCLCFSFPVAVLFSHLAFFLEYAYQHMINQEFFATVNLVRLIMGFLAMTASLKLTEKGWNQHVTFVGFLLFFMGALGLFSQHHIFVLGILCVGVSYYLLTPWLRKTRQHLIQLPQYAQHKNELLGVMIACDACSYFMAGVLATLPISLMNIAFMTFIFTIIVGSTSFYLLRSHLITRS